jgi:hypothetical protein
MLLLMSTLTKSVACDTNEWLAGIDTQIAKRWKKLTLKVQLLEASR